MRDYQIAYQTAPNTGNPSRSAPLHDSSCSLGQRNHLVGGRVGGREHSASCCTPTRSTCALRTDGLWFHCAAATHAPSRAKTAIPVGAPPPPEGSWGVSGGFCVPSTRSDQTLTSELAPISRGRGRPVVPHALISQAYHATVYRRGFKILISVSSDQLIYPLDFTNRIRCHLGSRGFSTRGEKGVLPHAKGCTLPGCTGVGHPGP